MTLKRLRFKSITTRCIFYCLFIILLLLVIINLVYPFLFYRIMQPYFNNNISGLMNGAATKISYILSHSNSTVYSFPNNDDIHELIIQYYDQTGDQEEAARKLNYFYELDEFKDKKVTEDYNLLTSTANMFLATEYGDVFYNPKLEDCVQTVLASDWYQEFFKNVNLPESELPERYADYENGIYSPVFQTEFAGEELEIICLISAYEVDGILCYPVLMTDFSDYKRQWSELTNIGLDDYILLGSDDRKLYCNLDEDSTCIDLENLDTAGEKQYEVHIQQDDLGMNYSVLISYPAEGLRLVIHATADVLLKPYISAYWIIMVSFVFVFSILLGFVAWMISKLLRRLKKLSFNMRRVKNGDYSVVLEDNSLDEIGTLTQTFNLMVSRIQFHIKDTLEHEKRERQIQYNLMVSAIDPHFIYNTLNTITYLAEQGNTDEIPQVNQALVDILKDRLKIKTNHSFDLVKNEIKLLKQYVYIQNHLCHHTTELIFDISDKDMECSIPKDILLPLVENALLHGILLQDKDKITNGKIKISIVKEETSLRLLVYDNGVGIDEQTIHRYFVDNEQMETIRETDAEHIGIYNIRARLAYLYQGQHHISARSILGKGTEVIIILPFY